jgi:hypothetical protein
LIDRYADEIAQDRKLADRFGGPLMTTFLLAMATPMVVLPLERLFKPATGGEPGVAVDVELDPALALRVADTLGKGRRFADAPFFREGAWRYVPACEAFEVGNRWPDDRLDLLDSEPARLAASQAPASDVLWTLRHSLAHGGVTYLDRNGRHEQQATHMLGFASFVNGSKRQRFRLLRVSVVDFRDFLCLWAGWLADAGAADALGALGPGYFQAAE